MNIAGEERLIFVNSARKSSATKNKLAALRVYFATESRSRVALFSLSPEEEDLEDFYRLPTSFPRRTLMPSSLCPMTVVL